MRRPGQVKILPVDPERLPGLMYFLSIDDAKRGRVLGYYLLRDKGHNVMVDVPPYDEELATQLTVIGGPRLMIITHANCDEEDFCHHDKWKEVFPDCCRMMHGLDMDPSTRFVEIVLRGGMKSWNIGEDIEVIPTPGRTAGHVCVLYRPKGALGGALLSGGMVGYDVEKRQVDAFPEKNAHSLVVQQESLCQLAEKEFEWLLPTGSGMHFFETPIERATTLYRLASELQIKQEERAAKAEGVRVSKVE